MLKLAKIRIEFFIMIIFIFFISCTLQSYGQNKQNGLIGVWYSVRSEYTNKEKLDITILYDDKWKDDTTFLYVIDENKAIFVRFADTIYSNYSLNNSNLKIGSKEFKIEKNKKGKMVILDISEEDCCRRYFFIRKEYGK